MIIKLTYLEVREALKVAAFDKVDSIIVDFHRDQYCVSVISNPRADGSVLVTLSEKDSDNDNDNDKDNVVDKINEAEEVGRDERDEEIPLRKPIIARPY